MLALRAIGVLTCALFFSFVPTVAQISITADDVRAQLAFGTTITERTDILTTSINIGSPGSSAWDFSALTPNITRVMTSVNPAFTPYGTRFPGATNALRTTVAATIGEFAVTATQYQYLTLDTSLSIPGNMAGATVPGLASGEFGTFHYPSENTFALPCTLGSAWNSAFVSAFACTLNGELILATAMNHNVSFVVDAYGPMILPGGSVQQALRVRKRDVITPVLPAGSPFTVMSYMFVARNGAMVNFTAFDTNQTRNVIRIGGVTTWRSESITDVPFSDNLPVGFTLMQNYPNPFNPSTRIRYVLPKSAFVTLRVFNAVGQEVARLVDKQQEAGTHTEVWDAEVMASGMYFYRLQAGDYTATKKMTLLR